MMDLASEPLRGDRISDGVSNLEGGNQNPNRKPKIVVIMGATGSGKSRLAIDLAHHFPVEIVNADSMQVYRGLDVLTNKVPVHEQNGVPHHLLGTISPNVEFTAKAFRDSAIPIIDDILSRNHLPLIVGGTNYYIQALVSPFLLDDKSRNLDDGCLGETHDEVLQDCDVDFEKETGCSGDSFDRLKAVDPVAANRIHPNNLRKIKQYLSLYAQTGVLPSKLFQGKNNENWGRVENVRYNCCFVCVDASLPVLDQFVGDRIDRMVDAGLLNEVFDIYKANADYSRGLLQAIGVREFEKFLRVYLSEVGDNNGSECSNEHLKENIYMPLRSTSRKDLKVLLEESIDSVKANTRRLVRRQKRRICQLQKLFGWSIHHVDATDTILGLSDDSWDKRVVQPTVNLIRSFCSENEDIVPDRQAQDHSQLNALDRDLWTQHICKACDQVLRGGHEWEQHKLGRRHRKRVSRLKKIHGHTLSEQQQILGHG